MEGFFTGEDFQPFNGAGAVIASGNRRIQHFSGRCPYIGSCAVSFDKGNDGSIRNIQGSISSQGN
jgi:hypothetical protein